MPTRSPLTAAAASHPPTVEGSGGVVNHCSALHCTADQFHPNWIEHTFWSVCYFFDTFLILMKSQWGRCTCSFILVPSINVEGPRRTTEYLDNSMYSTFFVYTTTYNNLSAYTAYIVIARRNECNIVLIRLHSTLPSTLNPQVCGDTYSAVPYHCIFPHSMPKGNCW